MSSSTSNFSKMDGRRLVALVFALLVIVELFTRVKLFRMSKDLVQFRAFPKRASQLVDQKAFRVALIGNSMTREGIDTSILEEDLQKQLKRPVRVEMFTADGSHIHEWRHMINRYFWSRGLRPDLAVITFSDSALCDRSTIEIGRFALFFTTRKDWPDVFRNDLKNPSDRIDFVISSLWATYATRDRLKEKTLDFIPNYKSFIARVNGAKAIEAPDSNPLQSLDEAPEEYSTLHRVLTEAPENGTKLCFIAYPKRRINNASPYTLDPKVTQAIRAARDNFIDLRYVPHLSESAYNDDIHLNAAGRIIYSHIMATALKPIITRSRS